jgi:hypothetical protein
VQLFELAARLGRELLDARGRGRAAARARSLQAGARLVEEELVVARQAVLGAERSSLAGGQSLERAERPGDAVALGEHFGAPRGTGRRRSRGF